MKSRRRRSRRKVRPMRLGEPAQMQAAINITPLVDVVLVLLIIFMVMAPQMSKGPDVDLPDTKKPGDQGDEPDPRVVIRGDARIHFREVRQVMLAIEQAGFHGVGLIAKSAGAKAKGD